MIVEENRNNDDNNNNNSNISNNDLTQNPSNISLSTAIEGPAPGPQNRSKCLTIVFTVIETLFSETAFILYLLIHWIISCTLHLKENRSNDEWSIIAFVYFISLLFAFMSVISHSSVFLIPLTFVLTLTEILILIIFVTKTFFIPIYLPGCNEETGGLHCQLLYSNSTQTYIWLTVLFFFIYLTLVCMYEQYERNRVFDHQLAQRAIYQEYYLNGPNGIGQFINHPPQFVGPVNVDEPPRYSTIEPSQNNRTEQVQQPATSVRSAETSPPRYSYWERTFAVSKNVGAPLNYNNCSKSPEKDK